MKKGPKADTPMMWTPPPPREIADMAIKEAARAATLAHPVVQRLQQKIEGDMQRAAKGKESRSDDAGGTPRAPRRPL